MKKSLLAGIAVSAIVTVCAFAFVSSHVDAADDPSKPEKKNGICGGAAAYYTKDDKGWAGGLCSQGTLAGSPSFPGVGGSSSWTCNGSNGGTDASCSASRSNLSNKDIDGSKWDRFVAWLDKHTFDWRRARSGK